MSPPLVITGMGLVSPVGLSAAASCAAFRAGVARIGPVHGQLFEDASGDPAPATGGRVPLEWFEGGPIEEEFPGHEAFALPAPPASHLFIDRGAHRLIELALPAADEAWRQARLDDRAPRSMGLYLGLDEADEPAPLADALSAALGVPFAVVRGDRWGRAGALAALHRAARHLREGRVDVALVGGVDSLVRPEVLERLTEGGVLKSDDHPQGILPGEAAAFLVLEAQPAAGVPAIGRLLGSAVGEEPTAGTDDANEGVGLTRVLRGAREAAGTALPAFPRVICDLNGDRYRAMEWAYALVRALHDLEPAEEGPGATERWHAAECTGDTGAASGLVGAVWGLTAMQRGYARSGTTLVWGASDGRLRAAAVLGI